MKNLFKKKTLGDSEELKEYENQLMNKLKIRFEEFIIKNSENWTVNKKIFL